MTKQIIKTPSTTVTTSDEERAKQIAQTLGQKKNEPKK